MLKHRTVSIKLRKSVLNHRSLLAAVIDDGCAMFPQAEYCIIEI
jgi:hypothetical protein